MAAAYITCTLGDTSQRCHDFHGMERELLGRRLKAHPRFHLDWGVLEIGFLRGLASLFLRF